MSFRFALLNPSVETSLRCLSKMVVADPLGVDLTGVGWKIRAGRPVRDNTVCGSDEQLKST